MTTADKTTQRTQTTQTTQTTNVITTHSFGLPVQVPRLTPAQQHQLDTATHALHHTLSPHLHALLILRPQHLATLLPWRWEQERARAQGLDREAVAKFVARFVPAYVRYLPRLYGPGGGKKAVLWQRDDRRIDHIDMAGDV